MSLLLHPKYNVEWTTYQNANFSTAKQKFSFAKSNRFPNLSKQVHDLVGYDLPDTKINRGASFGFGERSGLVPFKRKSPSPDKYELKSKFEQSLQESQSNRGVNKSFCFGTVREAFIKVVMPAKMNIPDSFFPGPGQYNSMKMIGDDKKKSTFGPKTVFNDISVIEKKKGVPGPGHYIDKLSNDSLGKYFVSTYQNSKAPSFSPSTRFRTLNQHNYPGPGVYELSGTVDYKDGKQILSTYHTRPDNANLKIATPGPGSYRPPSDSGYLDFKPKTCYQNFGIKTNRSTMTQNGRRTIMSVLDGTQKRALNSSMLTDGENILEEIKHKQHNRGATICKDKQLSIKQH